MPKVLVLVQVSEDLGYDPANSSSECEASLSAESAAALVISNITTGFPIPTTRGLDDGFTFRTLSEVTEADVQEEVGALPTQYCIRKSKGEAVQDIKFQRSPLMTILAQLFAKTQLCNKIRCYQMNLRHFRVISENDTKLCKNPSNFLVYKEVQKDKDMVLLPTSNPHTTPFLVNLHV